MRKWRNWNSLCWNLKWVEPFWKNAGAFMAQPFLFQVFVFRLKRSEDPCPYEGLCVNIQSSFARNGHRVETWPSINRRACKWAVVWSVSWNILPGSKKERAVATCCDMNESQQCFWGVVKIAYRFQVFSTLWCFVYIFPMRHNLRLPYSLFSHKIVISHHLP